MCIFFTRKVDKNTTYPLLVHAVSERPIAGISPTTYWPNSLFLSIQVEETGKHTFQKLLHSSDVGSYLKFGGQVVMWGHNLPPLVEIGLTDLPKRGWAIAHPVQPFSTFLIPYMGQKISDQYWMAWISMIFLSKMNALTAKSLIKRLHMLAAR